MGDRTPVQKGRRLEIHTILDDTKDRSETPGAEYDPLCLVAAKGSEDVSAPYRYTVTMWRFVDVPEHPPISPGDLINTPVEIRVNVKQRVDLGIGPKGFFQSMDTLAEPEINTWVRRCGVFETFNDEGVVLGEGDVTYDGKKYYLRQYAGTIVPAFKMMDYETGFRIFENKTALQIVRAIRDEYDTYYNNNSSFKIDDTMISYVNFPIIPYCVQYKESTFNFLSRLMADYGIWYYFDHDAEAPKPLATMVLGVGDRHFKAIRASGPQFDERYPINQLTLLNNKKLDPSVLTIQNMQENFNPMVRKARFGNNNILNPLNPITGTYDVQTERDLVSGANATINPPASGVQPPGNDDVFRMESFGISVDQNSPPDPPNANVLPNAPSAEAFAENWMKSKEAMVAKVSGATRNCAFIPGFTFDRIRLSPISGSPIPGQGLTDQQEEDKEIAASGADALVFANAGLQTKQWINTYVLIHIEFEAVDSSYSVDAGNIWKFITDMVFPSNVSSIDLLANGTAQGVNNYLQNFLPNQILSQPYPNGVNPGSYFAGFALGGGVAALTSAIPLLVQAIEKRINEQDDDFHCSFVAIPTQQLEYQGSRGKMTQAAFPSLPLPVGFRPSPGGPHLGVVIGIDGVTDDSDYGEIYADKKLGRVRVRFAWDREHGEQPGDCFKKPSPAAWVRVSEGWAGRQFGTQFLPRVGQEVIVDYIDGNIDRPIITGRVYNADHGFANLPFPENEQEQVEVKTMDLLYPQGSGAYRFTGIKTRSIPRPKQPPNAERYHLVRFDDTYNCEQYLLRSQGRLDVTAFASSFQTTYGNKNVNVVKGTLPNGQPVGGNMYTTVDQNSDLHVGASRYTQIDTDDEITVNGTKREHVKGNVIKIVDGTVSVGLQDLVIEAQDKITFKVGASFITIDHCEIYISAPAMIYENSGGTPGNRLPLAMMPVADATPAEPGDDWYKRDTPCTDQGSGGGTPQPVPVPFQGAPPCDTTINGVACGFLDNSPGSSSTPPAGSNSTPVSPSQSLSC